MNALIIFSLLLLLLLLLFTLLTLSTLPLLPRCLDKTVRHHHGASLAVLFRGRGWGGGIGLGGPGSLFLGTDAGLGVGRLALAAGRHQFCAAVVSLRRFRLRLQLIRNDGRQADVDVHLTP